MGKTAPRLFGSDEGEEHVEGHLDSVDEDQSVLGGDEFEVNGVDNGPDLPRTLACGKKIVLDLGSDSGEGVTVDQSKVGEEDSHEDGAPDNLIESNLGGDGLSVASWDEVIEPVVEVVSRGSVVKETKGGKGDESLHVEWSTRDENLQRKNNTALVTRHRHF